MVDVRNTVAVLVRTAVAAMVGVTVRARAVAVAVEVRPGLGVTVIPAAVVGVLVAFADGVGVAKATRTGTLLLLVDPLPSWPALLAPQHMTSQVATAHVLEPVPDAPPAPRRANVPATAFGAATSCAADPVPSWPCVLRPQHHAVPAVSTAQVWA